MASLSSTAFYSNNFDNTYVSPFSLPSPPSCSTSSLLLKTIFKLSSSTSFPFRKTSIQLINSQHINSLFRQNLKDDVSKKVMKSSFSILTTRNLNFISEKNPNFIFQKNPNCTPNSIICQAENGKPKGGESVDFDFDFDFDGLDVSELKADIQRLEIKRQAEKIGMNKGSRYYRETEGNGSAKGGGIKEVLEKVLVADFFFILAILAWFLAGIGQQQFTGETSLLNSWLPLWMPLFQPALGVFMAGALISAFNGWRNKDR